jgi:hypothetical protein
MAHFNDQEIAGAIAHHNAGNDADDVRQVLEETTPPGRPLERTSLYTTLERAHFT